MFKGKESSDICQESFSSDLFSIDTARLFKNVSNLKTDHCIYICNASYLDLIEREYTYGDGRYKVTYVKNQQKDQPLTVLAVKQNQASTNTEPTFKASVVTYTSDINNNIQIHFGRWMQLTDSETFLENHQKHRILFYMQQLNETEAVQNLRKQSRNINKAVLKKEPGAMTKLNEIDYFLKAIDTGDYKTVLSTLDNGGNSNLKAMIKPRPQIYTFFNFITFDFTARSARDTTTYKILLEIKNSDAIKYIRREILNFYEENLHHRTHSMKLDT